MNVLCQIPENFVYYNTTKTQDIKGETVQIPKIKNIFQSVFALRSIFNFFKKSIQKFVY